MQTRMRTETLFFLVDTYRSKQKMIGLDSIFVKFSDVVFHENSLIGSRVRLPDRMILIDAAPKKVTHSLMFPVTQIYQDVYSVGLLPCMYGSNTSLSDVC
jgi:hypothetical protein